MSKHVKKMQKGDLVEIGLVIHRDNRYEIVGRFMDLPGEHVLARVGEGKDDIRPAEVVKLIAESVMKEIQSTYATMAFLRRKN